MPQVIRWFRRDLRVSDNTALGEAARLAFRLQSIESLRFPRPSHAGLTVVDFSA